MQEIPITDSEVAFRRGKVAEYLAKGYSNQAELSRIFKVHESTISRDVQYLREQATAQMNDYLSDLPLQHAKARLVVDIILRKAFELLDVVDNEAKLDVMKVILSATQTRVDFLSDVTAIQEAAKKAAALKKQLADLKKAKPAPFEVVSDIEPASGRKGTVTRRIVKKGKKEAFTPVV